MVLKSRNTMIVSAVLFLLVVILLRVASGFVEDNVVRVIGSVMGGAAEKIPLIDFSTINLSWINPANWSMDGITTGINEWLHGVIDSVLPAFIHTLHIGAVTAVITRVKIMGAVAKVSPIAIL